MNEELSKLLNAYKTVIPLFIEYMNAPDAKKAKMKPMVENIQKLLKNYGMVIVQRSK